MKPEAATVEYEYRDSKAWTIMTYKHKDGSPMSSRFPGVMAAWYAVEFLDWLRANDRNKGL